MNFVERLVRCDDGGRLHRADSDVDLDVAHVRRHLPAKRPDLWIGKMSAHISSSLSLSLSACRSLRWEVYWDERQLRSSPPAFHAPKAGLR
jgi:hypothetical protein